MSHPLDEILHLQKRGEPVGIPSICSAHPWVLKTALQCAAPVLVESTCNQVNQFGGYTGMTPADFADFVRRIAAENGFPVERVILGGDHLGPSPWQGERAESAMAKACAMVLAYVRAGFTKIHLDASMWLGGDDPACPLDPGLAARRSALLAKAAETAADRSSNLRYVIGTDVPIPGGATGAEEALHVTSVEDVQRTIELTRAAFAQAGLETAWEKVLAVVVQPGVDFGDDFAHAYESKKARDLVTFIETTPLVYEAHSTDYQAPDALKALVRDHFAVLKVGPALTNAFRETVFALSFMEAELFPKKDRSRLIETLDAAMLRQPEHWEKHYRGSKRQTAFARKYSLSDRLRYYWFEPDVQASLSKLLSNLGTAPLPVSLIRQFLPDLYPVIRAGQMPTSPTAIIHSRIQGLLAGYSSACGSTNSF